MSTELDLAQKLFEAQKDGRHDVDPALLAGLDRAAAYRVQTRVMDMLGERPALIKTAIAPDSVGIVAPIFASRVGQSGSFSIPATNITGLEVEVGLVLGSDLDSATASADPAAITDAIDYYFVGVEICGTRFTDRIKATPAAGLADSLSAHGYVINPRHRELGADIEAFDVRLEFAGREIFSGAAKHSFGTVLASFIAYAKDQHPAYPLRAGGVVTTGSLCGLVPVSGIGRAVATFGIHTVEFDIT